MRLNLSVGIVGDERGRSHRYRPVAPEVTVPQYLGWVERLPLHDAIKDRFRRLTKTTPSTMLGRVILEAYRYTATFEKELNDAAAAEVGNEVGGDGDDREACRAAECDCQGGPAFAGEAPCEAGPVDGGSAGGWGEGGEPWADAEVSGGEVLDG